MPHVRRAAAAVVLLIAVAAGCSSDEPEDTTAFCNAFRGASAINGPVSQLDLDDDTTVSSATSELAVLVELAPDAVADDVEVVAEVYDEVLRALADAPPGGRADALRDLQPRLDEAGAPALRLQSYGSSECDVAFEAPAQPTPTPTPLDIED